MNSQYFLWIKLLFFSITLGFSNKSEFNQKFIEVAKEGNPTVVSIISETVQENNLFQGFGNLPREFEDMFPKHKEKGRSLGSGVIIDKENGYIVTNNHVVQNAESIKIVLYDDRELEATVVGMHENTDLAVLKIKPIK